MTLLACQHDPRLRSLQTRVLSCDARGDDRFSVRLEDTVLYPEGGGQPADHGDLDGVPVLDVQREAGGVVHVTRGPVPRGPVTATVDWARRFDHMQQHSAQHLLTAVAHDRFGRPTVGFHLGEALCTIDLEGKRLGDRDLQQLQDDVNEVILEARPLRHRAVDRETYDALTVRSRGLPAGHTGAVRLVEIEGIDCNTCGGTHVQHTGELQALVLVRSENLKGGQRLHWLAGKRAVRALTQAIGREAALSSLLTAPPAEHVDMVARLQASAKQAAKDKAALLRELAQHLGRQLALDAAASGAEAVHLHRDGADLGALKGIATAARAVAPELRLLLTGDGVFLVAGPADRVAAAGPDIAKALHGRGGGRGGLFQGKAKAVGAAPTALELLKG